MHQLRDYYKELLQQELNEIKEREEIYYIEFQDETKSEVNTFKQLNFLSDKCNQKVDELTTDSKNGFSFKVLPILQLNLLSDIKKNENFSYENTFYKYLTQTKGNIYLKNCEVDRELKKKLKEAYPFIENAIETSFIKSRESNNAAVLLTFNLHTLYIPVQPSDTTVCKYQDQSMICRNFLKNRHTKIRCRRRLEFGEIAEKMTTHVTKQINGQINLSVQTVERNTRQEAITVKLK